MFRAPINSGEHFSSLSTRNKTFECVQVLHDDIMMEFFPGRHVYPRSYFTSWYINYKWCLEIVLLQAKYQRYITKGNSTNRWKTSCTLHYKVRPQQSCWIQHDKIRSIKDIRITFINCLFSCCAYFTEWIEIFLHLNFIQVVTFAHNSYIGDIYLKTSI